MIDERVAQTLERRERQAGACRIVHQHPVVVVHVRPEGLDTGQHRVAPLGAAHGAHVQPWIEAAQPSAVFIAGRNDDHDPLDPAGRKQRRHRPFEHAAPGQRQVLLRHGGTHARADARRRNDRPAPPARRGTLLSRPPLLRACVAPLRVGGRRVIAPGRVPCGVLAHRLKF